MFEGRNCNPGIRSSRRSVQKVSAYLQQRERNTRQVANEDVRNRRAALAARAVAEILQPQVPDQAVSAGNHSIFTQL